MVTQTITQKSQTSTKKSPIFWEIKVRGEWAKYRARVGDYVAGGLTENKEESVREVVNRMAAAENDLIDKLKQLVSSVVDNVVAVSQSGASDVGTYMGTTFHLGEYMGIKVTIQRVTHPRASTRWWGRVMVMFKGYDGYRVLSKHKVWRYVEFYNDTIPRDKLYNVIYEAARIAFNAYKWSSKNH